MKKKLFLGLFTVIVLQSFTVFPEYFISISMFVVLFLYSKITVKKS